MCIYVYCYANKKIYKYFNISFDYLPFVWSRSKKYLFAKIKFSKFITPYKKKKSWLSLLTYIYLIGRLHFKKCIRKIKVIFDNLT